MFGSLVLVRHGQANAADLENYDRLSPFGVAQSRRLGEHLARNEIQVDRVRIGPLRRHRETWEAAVAAAGSVGAGWPAPEEEPLLDEHDGLRVFSHHRDALSADAELGPLLSSSEPRDVFTVFRVAMERWSTGALDSPGEDFAGYRARAAAAVAALTDPDTVGLTTICITSAGLVAGAVGAVLEVSDAHTLRLNWSMFNTSWTEIRYQRDWQALERFNATPHLDPKLLTRV